MATFTAAKDGNVFVNGYELTGYFSQSDVSKSAEAFQTTTFGNDAHTRIGTLKDGQWSASGFLDESTSGGVGEVLDAALGDDHTEISFYPTGDAVGEIGYGVKAVETSKEVSAPVAGVVEVTAEAQANNAAERLTSRRALSSATASGTATSVDNSASSSAGAVGFLHVTSLAGGTLTVKYQDSTDDNTYADLLTFTATSASTFSERVSVTGTVDQYTRVVHTLTGGTAIFQTGFGRLPHD